MAALVDGWASEFRGLTGCRTPLPFWECCGTTSFTDSLHRPVVMVVGQNRDHDSKLRFVFIEPRQLSRIEFAFPLFEKFEVDQEEENF
jgi:hypothetical protein